MTASPDVPRGTMTTKQIEGDYLIFRKRVRGIKRTVGGRSLPWFRHKTFESAETEATRLAGLFPDSTFIIMREIATVKVRESK